DVDMKVVVDGASTMSKSALRSLLSETKHAITDAIKAAGFIMPEEPKARNGNQHQLRDLGTATRRL
ncbi:MAG TPA: hypothetical protein VLL76_04655, partial [Candidatus Omnitrophota bacterium]|nr:hypothetical protein [Candidatus Omnitrophota bacterium]